MTEKAGDPQLSWMTIVGAVAIVGLMSGGQWVVSQTQFASVEKTELADREQLGERITILEREQRDTLGRLAHDPVEKATMDAIISATDKRMDLFQSQITDINRQIAAALIIIDSNAGKKSPAVLPP